MRKLICLTICTLLWAGLAQAQGVTTGSLAGVVLDPNNEALPGVAVVATLPATGNRYGTVADVEIRRAGLEDIEQAMALNHALVQHLAAAPIFLCSVGNEGRTFHEQWLTNSDNALWLAYQGREVTACLGFEPANTDACYIIRDEKTTSITSAFTAESERGNGIATTLLNHALAWARSVGYQRCAVDFEPQNIPAAHFWLRHFQPVCYSQIRHVDERVA